MKGSAVAPVVRSVEVAASVERSFAVFVDEIAQWWPLELHSIFQKDARSAKIERFVGGRVFEVAEDGREAEWGRVLEFEPPHRLVLEWKPNTRPTPPTRVEVVFETKGDHTHVQLTHTGWEALGDEAEDARSGYDEGWVLTLERYVSFVS